MTFELCKISNVGKKFSNDFPWKEKIKCQVCEAKQRLGSGGGKTAAGGDQRRDRWCSEELVFVLVTFI